MWNQMGLPALQINMNPRLGMVAVPTWFWVDGYDGNTLPLADTLLLPHEECRRVVDRDGRGDPILDGNGHPSSHRECRTLWDSLTVEVLAWPSTYSWDFGDSGGQRENCPGVAACTVGLGRAYTDPHSPSPVAHAYTWSSLGVNGDADAYTIRLGITFGAQYRFSINDAPLSGWQRLNDREVSATATHRVQEAQAVLSGP
jgi:hypothetical protein